MPLQARLLLDHGADPTLTDAKGDTPVGTCSAVRAQCGQIP